ncbi:MAG: choice-of-anchor I family protein [Cocleimonas sp.]
MNRKYLNMLMFAMVLNGCNSSSSITPLEALDISCATVNIANDDEVSGKLELNVIGTYGSGNDFDSASAEIVSYDSCSDRLYVVNAKDQTIDVLSMNAEGIPSKEKTIDLNAAATQAGIAIGDANSVSAKKGLVAVAIQAATKQDDGIIALYRSDTLALINVYKAGALPDMVILSEDARYILSANEGEPSSDYSNDPEGSVTIVDTKDGFDENALVKQVSFAGFAAADLSGVRLAGPAGTSVAQDLEPEYLTLSTDGSKAWVAMQENNAIAIINVASATVTSIVSMGKKPWNPASGNQLDASNRDDNVGNFASYEQLVGLYMPDTITNIEIDGETYILSANEGDGREYIYDATQQTCDTANHTWDGDDNAPMSTEYSTVMDDCISFLDEARGGDIVDNVAATHPLKAALESNDELKRIKIVNDVASYAAGDDIVAFGARSFSIWNENAELVFDSGDDLAKNAFADNTANFNSTNDENDSADNRSDDKGIEPEAIEAAWIGNRAFAFIGLERQGGVMVYDITDPTTPVYQSYLNNRNFNENVCTVVDGSECDNDTYNPAAGDLAPESIDYFSREGKHYIAVGNEVSGTTTVYNLSFNDAM